MEGYALDPNMLVNALTRDNDGFMGGNNGLLWIFLLILFGGNGFGFGNRGGVAEVGAIDAAITKAQAQGCSNELILTAIGGNKEAINQLGSYLGVEVNQIQAAVTSLGNGLCELGYKMGQDTATIISNITSGNAALSRQLAECCCQTQRAIDGVNYNMATQFANTNSNMDKQFCALSHYIDKKIDAAQAENRAGFQGVRDYLVGEKITSLQTDLQSAQAQLSQMNQTQVIKDYIASYFGCPPGTFPCPCPNTTA